MRKPPILEPLTLDALKLQPLFFKSAVERIDLLNARGQSLSDKIADSVQAWTQGYIYQVNNAFYKHFVNNWDLQQARTFRVDRSLIETGYASLDARGDEVSDDMTEATEDTYQDGFTFGLWDIYRHNAASDLPDVPSDDDTAALVAAGAVGGILLADRLQRWIGDSKIKLRNAIKVSMVRGMSLDDTTGLVDTLGEQTFSRLDLLGEAELQRTFHQGQAGALQATFGPDYANLLLGEMWLTRNDGAVCPMCFLLNKTITKLLPIVDTHPGCRCIKVPVFNPAELGNNLDINPISLEDFRSQL